MANKLKKISTFEIVAYSIIGALGLWGFVYTILGFTCEFLSNKSALREANTFIKNMFGTGFLTCGLIVLGVSAVAALVILLINAKKSDRDFEKAQRRAARLKKKPDEEIVDVPSEQVEAAE